MCQFPSWIEMQDGTILFLEDKDIDNLCSEMVENCCGHSAIRYVFPRSQGHEIINGRAVPPGLSREGFPCPPEIVKAIRAGKMRRIMRADGFAEIHVNDAGEVHRVGGPALVMIDNDAEYWYDHNKKHRSGAPAVVGADGYKEWCWRGQIHRVDGPAVIESDGVQSWAWHELVHRLDGPAKTWPDGREEWYLYGVQYPDQKAHAAALAELREEEADDEV